MNTDGKNNKMEYVVVTIACIIGIPIFLWGVGVFDGYKFEGWGASKSQAEQYHSQPTNNYQGNEDYKRGYSHGKSGRNLGASSAREYCEKVSQFDMTVPGYPSDAWTAGFNDAYNGNDSQY